MLISTPDASLYVERSELADIAIQCMCTLLTEATHFNFRQNLIACIITRLSKKSWDEVRTATTLF
jgi:hypothetical protein